MADIIIDSDNVVEVLAVENSVTGIKTDTATVLVSLYDTDTDQLITGQTFPHTLTAEGGATGNYRGNLVDVLALAPCMLLRAEFSIDDGPGLYREWESLYDAVYGNLEAQIFLDNTDNTITLDGLDDAVSPGAFLDAATVEVTLTDLAGVDIAGQVWPFALTAAGSGGLYEGNLNDTLDVTDGDIVKVLLTADNGADEHREWRSILTVQTGV
jgi:hypothetical protein